MKAKIIAVLDEIQPFLQGHSGGVEFVDFEAGSGVLSVRMTGACHGCPMAQMTLKSGIESFVRERIPEVREVKAVE